MSYSIPKDISIWTKDHSNFIIDFDNKSEFILKLFQYCRSEDDMLINYGEFVYISNYQTNTFLECIDDRLDNLMQQKSIPDIILNISQLQLINLESQDSKQESQTQ